VEFAETDAAGMVHFSVFFRYMEEAEHAVWRETNSWPRISAHFDFKTPLRFQDEFVVQTEMASVTRSTIQWAHVLTRGDVVIGTGTVTAVYVKKLPDGTIKSTDIPDEIISRLRSVRGA
jgi:acyl-CoA thioester hydrolase